MFVIDIIAMTMTVIVMFVATRLPVMECASIHLYGTGHNANVVHIPAAHHGHHESAIDVHGMVLALGHLNKAMVLARWRGVDVVVLVTAWDRIVRPIDVLDWLEIWPLQEIVAVDVQPATAALRILR